MLDNRLSVPKSQSPEAGPDGGKVFRNSTQRLQKMHQDMTYRTTQKSLTRNNSGEAYLDIAEYNPEPLTTNLIQYNRLNKPRNTIDM